MKHTYKTGKQNRETYIYYNADGDKQDELIAGVNGITKSDIERLHEIDDENYNNEKRHLEHSFKYKKNDPDGEEEIPDDKNKILRGVSKSPEQILFPREVKKNPEKVQIKECLNQALKTLQPQQIDLYYKYYGQQLTAKEIAEEEGTTMQAIYSRLGKIKERVGKYMQQRGINAA